jgi:hypothetical protein
MNAYHWVGHLMQLMMIFTDTQLEITSKQTIPRPSLTA